VPLNVFYFLDVMPILLKILNFLIKRTLDTVVNIDDRGSIAAISGTAIQGQTLTAGAITDADEGVRNTSYQWKANGIDILGAKSSRFILN